MRFAWRSPAIAAAIVLLLPNCSNSHDVSRARVQSVTVGGRGPLAESGARLVAAGESTYWAGKYDSAQTLWRRALQTAHAAGNDTAEARILTWLGLTSWRKGDYKDARQLGESALALKVRLKLVDDLFKSYNALGLLAWNEGRLTDAAKLFDQAMIAARDRNDREGIGKASGNLALVQGEMGEFAKAGEGFALMRQVGMTLKDARIEGNALDNLGMLRIKLGEPASAIALLLNARRLYHSIDYGNGEQNALGQLGTAYEALGDHRAAFAALDSALTISRQENLRQEVASNLEIIAGLYRDAGDVPRALQFYREAQATEKELGLSIQGAANLRNTAEIFQSLGRLDTARALAIGALRMHRAAKAQSEEVRDLLFLAELTQTSMRSQPMDYLSTADRLIEKLGWQRARVDLALTRARIADRARQPRTVLSVLHSLDRDLARGDLDVEWQTSSLTARAYARLGALDSAIAIGRRAVAAVEQIRGSIGSGVLRNSYLAERETAYMDLVDALLRAQRVEEALEISDKMRGRALREHLVALEADSSKGGGEQVQALVEEETILRRIDALQQRLEEVDAASASEPDSMSTVAAKGLAEKLAATREQYESVVIRGEQLEEGSRSLLGGTTIVASEVRGALRPGEALIEYLVTPARLIAFVVSPSSVRVVQTNINAQNLTAHVRVALGVITTSALRASAANVMRTLHEDLFSHAIRSEIPAGTRRLIIVTHSILSYVPFSALRDPVTGRYVVEEFDIVRLPSAAALPTLRNRKRDTDATTVGFRGADVLAPFPTNLPGTLREAHSAARSIPRSNVYVGQAANEPRLRSALNGDRLVHVATHGVMNARNPMFSRIELSRGTAPGSADDGRLEVHEVLRLRVRSPLVFLSGCETAAGAAGATQWSRGEDYATLAQAFLYAGTRDVIATLWQIQDDGAADFAGRFYRYLRSFSSADALARTQREMIRDPRFGAPYYWASYVISGEGLPTTETQKRQVSAVQYK